MNKTHYDELLDSKIKCAGYEMLGKLAEQAPSEQEIAQFEMSTDALDKRVAASISSEVGKRRAFRALKISAKVAAVLLVLVAISTVTITSTEALRVPFLNYFLDKNEKEAVITVTDAENEDPIGPAYMTEGYELVDYMGGKEDFAVCTYAGSGDDYIRIERLSANSSFSYDTERSTSYETEIVGFSAIVVEWSDVNMVYLFANDYVFTINGTVSLEEIIKITEGLPL